MIDTGYRIGLLEVYTNLSELHTEEENYKDALKLAEKAMSLAKKLGASSREIPALRAMGKALSKRDPEKAISYIKQSITLAEKERVNWELAVSLYELAKILKITGKIREAEKHIEEAKRIFQKSGAEVWCKKIEELNKKQENRADYV